MDQHPVIRSAGSAGKPSLPIGEKLLVAFFWFGAAMCLLTVLILAFPDSVLTPLRQLKPEVWSDFQRIGGLAFLLMSAVGLACVLAAIGLAKGASWGRRLAIVILSVNLLGDSANAFIRHDYWTLLGLPIGGAMIFYLIRGGDAAQASNAGSD